MVYEYSRPYTRFWKNAAAHVKPRTASLVFARPKRKRRRKRPVKIQAMVPVPLRPTCLSRP